MGIFSMPYDIGSLVELHDGFVYQVKSYRLSRPIMIRLILLGTTEERLVELTKIKSQWDYTEQ